MLVSTIGFQDMGEFDPSNGVHIPAMDDGEQEAELSDQEFERNRADRIAREQREAREKALFFIEQYISNESDNAQMSVSDYWADIMDPAMQQAKEKYSQY